MDGNITGCFIIRFVQWNRIGALVGPPTLPGPAGPGNRIPEAFALLIQSLDVDIMLAYIFIGQQVMHPNQPPIGFPLGGIGFNHPDPIFGFWSDWLSAAFGVLDKAFIITLVNQGHGSTPS
jgi:hypothetical protein